MAGGAGYGRRARSHQSAGHPPNAGPTLAERHPSRRGARHQGHEPEPAGRVRQDFPAGQGRDAAQGQDGGDAFHSAVSAGYGQLQAAGFLAAWGRGAGGADNLPRADRSRLPEADRLGKADSEAERT